VVYRRRELWLLLVLAASLGVGLAVREFRSRFPEPAERLEQFDVEESPAPAPTQRAPSLGAETGTGSPAPAKLSETAIQSHGRLDLNHATPADLRQLPGIGPTLAQRIVEARERQGRFISAEDLRRVPGIGPKKFEAIRELVTVRE